MLASLLFAIAAGALLAIQGAVNASLACHVGRLQAALVSFATGTLLLLIISLAMGSASLLGAITSAEPWQLLGGLYGAIIVIAMIYATPVLGAALTSAAFMAGQLAFGMFIDGFGWFGMPVLALHPLRVVGCAIVALGIVAVCYGRGRHARGVSKDAAPAESRKPAAEMLLLLLSFIAGVCSSIQAPTNAGLALSVGSVNASLVNMFVGFLVVLAVTLVRHHGRLVPLPLSLSWWKYLGGACGSAYVLLVVLATPGLGVGITMGALMLGQLVGGVTLDTFGLAGCAKSRITPWHAVGILLIAIGVILTAISKVLA